MRRNKTSPILGFLLFVWVILPLPLLLYISTLRGQLHDAKKEVEIVRSVLNKPVIIKEVQAKPEEPTQTPSPTEAPKKTQKRVNATSTSPQVGTWIGKVSHYSRAGCLGCSPNLTMANGKPLDDEAMTIAFNWLPMNTKVRLTNLDNGKSCEATVTDTGGFNKLGRIADLVPAVARALETKTDISQVKIEVIN